LQKRRFLSIQFSFGGFQISKHFFPPFQLFFFSSVQKLKLNVNWTKFHNYLEYIQTCTNGHLWTTATYQQQPARIPSPTKPTMTLPRILDQPLNNSHPLNNGHFFGVPRVAVVHGFYCTWKKTIFVKWNVKKRLLTIFCVFIQKYTHSYYYTYTS
jgi:hypothetical protein